MRRINTANTIDLAPGKKGFRGKNTGSGLPGTPLAADWFNDVQEEIAFAVEASGQALGATPDQIFRAMRSQRGNAIYPDRVTGTANDVALSLAGSGAPPITDYAQIFLTPIRFVFETANSGAMRVNIDGVGFVDLRWPDNTTIANGEVVAGLPGEIFHDGLNFKLFTPLSSTQVRNQKVTRFSGTGNVSAASGFTVPCGAVTVASSTLVTSTWSAGVFTVGAGEDGIWIVSMSGTLATSNAVTEGFVRKNGFFGVGTYVNGYSGWGPSGANAKGSACFPVPMGVGETLNFESRHNAAGTVNTFVTIDLYRSGRS